MYDVLARYYDHIHANLQEDLDFVLDLADQYAGPIMELGCGTGRLLLPLIQAGYTVTGVDNEQAMLGRARKRLEEESEEVRKRVILIQADLRSMVLPDGLGDYGLILFSYNTLLHFKADEMRRILRRVRSMMHKDGRLFLDSANPYLIEGVDYEDYPVVENSFSVPETGEIVIQKSQSRLDFGDQCLHTTWFFETRNQTGLLLDQAAVEIAYWYQFPHQLELLLTHAGFRLERIMGDYDYSAFSEDSERLLIIARPLD